MKTLEIFALLLVSVSCLTITSVRAAVTFDGPAQLLKCKEHAVWMWKNRVKADDKNIEVFKFDSSNDDVHKCKEYTGRDMNIDVGQKTGCYFGCKKGEFLDRLYCKGKSEKVLRKDEAQACCDKIGGQLGGADRWNPHTCKGPCGLQVCRN